MQEILFVAGPVGKLETVVEMPNTDEGSRIAVVCHPHSLHGGSMTNKVVTTCAKALLALNMPVIRFNFRGVGQSGGEYAAGMGETDDLAAVIEWALKQYPQRKIWLAGFSFGSFVAANYANQHPIEQLISIAPPVHHFDFARLTQIHCPWLIIQGEQDDVVPPTQVFDWAKNLPSSAQLLCMPEASHFFHGQLITLKQQLIDKLEPGSRSVI